VDDPGGCWLALRIVWMNLGFAVDNVILIIVLTRNLRKDLVPVATTVGILGAILIRLISIIWILPLVEKWSLPLQFFGGILLVYATYKLIEDEEQSKVHGRSNFLIVIFLLIGMDALLSFDSTISIYYLLKDNVTQQILAVAVNIPIIWLIYRCGVKTVYSYPSLMYFIAAMLAYTSVEMILMDENINLMKYQAIDYLMTNHLICWIAAIAIIIYGGRKMAWYKRDFQKIKTSV